jgi:hypothetical protein
MGRVVIWTITLPYHVVVWIESLGCKAGIWIQAKWENARVRVGGTLPGFSSVLIFYCTKLIDSASPIMLSSALHIERSARSCHYYCYYFL